ncbi:MAG TPA: class I SAM-dependent methyltransferase [Myxococcota bacterium]|nr:class I SAM-dependent methyltransferase [Myxococcota bacterium]
MTFVAILLMLLLLVVAVCLVWRWSRWPCPAWLVPLLENPYFEAVAGAKTVLERAGVRFGMRVLDAGCGPGRLTLPAAARVGPSGRVVALDIQAAMLEKLKSRVATQGLANVEFFRAGLGDGKLPASEFDVALLVTVLGEIPDQIAALRELHRSLRPGGVLSVTEVLPDPHYQTVAHVRQLAAEVGFHESQIIRGWLSFTMNLTKPAAT